MIKRGPSFPATIVGRMEAIEKRLNGKLQALKTVRPAWKLSTQHSENRKPISPAAGVPGGSGTGSTAGRRLVLDAEWLTDIHRGARRHADNGRQQRPQLRLLFRLGRACESSRLLYTR